jgi:ESF2/ABP1 family protein
LRGGGAQRSANRCAPRLCTVRAANVASEGGRKRDAFYYDLWTIKYLPKFKWEDLTEEVGAPAAAAARRFRRSLRRTAYQKAVKEQRLALELSATKRERDFYLKQVDTAKGLAAMAEKRAKREAAAAASEAADAPPQAAVKAASGPRVQRTFSQRGVRAKPTAPRVSSALLAGVFGERSHTPTASADLHLLDGGDRL